MPALALTITATTGRRFIPLLRRHLPVAHRLLESPLRELSIALLGDRRMAALHDRFMQIDAPTDVLTFPIELDRRSRPVAADVAICVPEALRRARQLGTRPGNELLLYALHGLLHLNGFDDRTDRGHRRMHEMEDRILKKLGIGPVFQPRGLKGRR